MQILSAIPPSRAPRKKGPHSLYGWNLAEETDHPFPAAYNRDISLGITRWGGACLPAYPWVAQLVVLTSSFSNRKN